jgi:hypothetical protein
MPVHEYDCTFSYTMFVTFFRICEGDDVEDTSTIGTPKPPSKSANTPFNH